MAKQEITDEIRAKIRAENFKIFYDGMMEFTKNLIEHEKIEKDMPEEFEIEFEKDCMEMKIAYIPKSEIISAVGEIAPYARLLRSFIIFQPYVNIEGEEYNGHMLYLKFGRYDNNIIIDVNGVELYNGDRNIYRISFLYHYIVSWFKRASNNKNRDVDIIGNYKRYVKFSKIKNNWFLKPIVETFKKRIDSGEYDKEGNGIEAGEPKDK